MGETLPSAWSLPPLTATSPTISPLHHPLSATSSLNSTASSCVSSSAGGTSFNPYTDDDTVLMIERRSFRPFKSNEDYLFAMREDLAEWLNGLYELNISADDFFEKLENGVALCKHANNVRKSAFEQRATFPPPVPPSPKRGSEFRYEIPLYDVQCRDEAAPGSFFARDNVHNFIRWCRDLGVHDVLMFETDDLVLRKNEKHVTLALLEIARRGARFGMEAPLLVQMEVDIDREMEADRLEEERRRLRAEQEGVEGEGSDVEVEDEGEEIKPEAPMLIYGPQAQVVTNDLKSLDEMVRELVARCSCPSQFPMIKVSEGKYRIGDTKVLIFVRILRNHVMVRVGGGWDTLQHYLDKHDPCRCRQGHRTTISAKMAYKNSLTGEYRPLQSVKYERSEEGFSPSSPATRRKSTPLRRDSEGRSSLRRRSQSPAITDGSPKLGLRPPISFRPNVLLDAPAAPPSPDMWCDSSSEVSDEGYRSQGVPKPPPRRRPKNSEDNSSALERPDSSMTHLSSEGSSVSTDDLGVPPSPPRSPPVYITPDSSHLETHIPQLKQQPQWPSSTHSSKDSSPNHINRQSSNKAKFPFMDAINSRFMASKKSKSSVPEITMTGSPQTTASRLAWNCGPGLRRDSEPRSRRSSQSSDDDGRALTRSRSATSEGGLQTMMRRESSGLTRQSMRGGGSRQRLNSNSGKNTWNGRNRLHDGAQNGLPPPVRSVRSASASPAAVRRHFPSSAPTTPAHHRSPKRSVPISPSVPVSSLNSPLDDVLGLHNIKGEDTEILHQLEGLVNNYRLRILQKYADEGRAPPPELSEDQWAGREPENTSHSSLPTRCNPRRITPRKDGIGSRIPVPIFFKPQQAEI